MAKLTCSKKGISTIIGGFIFLVIMVSAFTAFIIAFQIMTDLMEAQVKIGTESITKAREEFSVITSVKPSQANRLYVQVENTGNTPIQISDAWIINKTSSPYAATLYEIAYQDSFIAPGSTKNIFENTLVTLQNKYHDIKVVSSIGTIVTKELIVPLRPLNATMFISPSHISNGNNSTLSLLVTNRGNATVYDVKPELSAASMTNPASSIGDFTGPIPASTTLEPQESEIFKWNFRLYGAVGTTTVFTNNAIGTDSITGDTVKSPTAKETVQFIPSARAFQQLPEVQMVVPAPFGERAEHGLWAVVVTNPTSIPITVSRVIVTANSVLESPTKVFPINCANTPITPVTGWSCPASNILVWTDASPISIPAFSAQEFSIRVEPGVLGGSQSDYSYLVSATILSSYGITAKTGIVSSMENAQTNAGVVANVYLTRNGTGVNPLLNTNMFASDVGIKSGTNNYAFNMTLADLGTSNDGIAAGAKLVINIPSGFTDIEIINCNQFPGCTKTTYPDGSTQISGTLASALGTSGSAAATISFRADIPTVNSNALYVVLVLAEGKTTATSAFPVFPVAEITLHLVP